VALVLDQDYGEELKELAKRMAIWIIGTPSNAAVARELWNQEPKPPYMITIFRPPSELDESCFEYLMDEIELHHGYYSQTPPFAKLEVIGLEPSATVDTVLAEYEFGPAERTITGFCAVRVRELRRVD
jgi:hypothetical protein